MAIKLKQKMLLITFAVVLFAGLMNLQELVSLLGAAIRLIYPVLLGGLLAFVLNVPMRGFERRLTALSKKSGPEKEKIIRFLSLFLTLLTLLLLLTLVVVLVVPELVRSLTSLYELVQEKLPQWLALLNSYDVDTSWISEKLEQIDLQEMLNKIGSGAGSMLSSVVDIASSTVSGVANVVFAVIISIYMLLSKADLSRQGKKLLYAHLREQTADEITRILRLIRDTYAKFLSGQCVEALILGSLMFVAFTAFNLPYASLIAALTSVCALIPYIGAFTSCFFGTFLTLLADPSHVLLCLAVYLVVQFVENQFIYPHVVGGSVGLSPLWTLMGALIGGKLIGVLGVVFFIPLVAVIHTLLGEDANRRLEKKNIQIRS